MKIKISLTFCHQNTTQPIRYLVHCLPSRHVTKQLYKPGVYRVNHQKQKQKKTRC